MQLIREAGAFPPGLRAPAPARPRSARSWDPGGARSQGLQLPPTSRGRGGVAAGAGGKTGSPRRSGSLAHRCPGVRSCSHAMPANSSQLQLPPSPPAAQELGATPRPHGELQYLGQIEHILRFGSLKEDRTRTGTLSVFGMQARYSLRGDSGRARLRAGGRQVGWQPPLGKRSGAPAAGQRLVQPRPERPEKAASLASLVPKLRLGLEGRWAEGSGPGAERGGETTPARGRQGPCSQPLAVRSPGGQTPRGSPEAGWDRLANGSPRFPGPRRSSLGAGHSAARNFQNWSQILWAAPCGREEPVN